MSVTIDGQTIEIKQEIEESPVKEELDYPREDDDVQRAIESLKEIKDEQLQEFLDDDLLENFDVIDTWEGDENKRREAQNESQNKEREHRRPSRERHRREREKPRRDEKKREETRRDPSKSTKDIERDKIRAKRDNEIKLLAEREKAIKNLLDSDDVVPPGTEEEAIESIAEKQNQERVQIRNRRSKERRRSLDRGKHSSPRRRSSDRFRPSPTRRRSPTLASPERRKSPYRRSPPRYFDRRSPYTLSPERRRSPGRNWEQRRSSPDRRWSTERPRRRTDALERRRSRSHDRQRSRSPERLRRRSSRSPIDRRYSPRRRSRSRSRSPDRRTRKRSSFINELARQLTQDALMSSHSTGGFPQTACLDGLSPSVYPDQQLPPYIHQPMASAMQPTGMSLPAPPPPPTPFMPYESQPQTISYDSMNIHPPMQTTEYSSGPVLYNQPNSQLSHRPPLLPGPMPVAAPQPVPAPTPMEHAPIPPYSPHTSPHPLPVHQHHETHNKYIDPTTSSQNYKNHKSKSPYKTYRPEHEERLKTPEPPVISSSKNFEKASLSSLLEASVSGKDSSGPTVVYPGFRPEIYRRCEQALRELHNDDPRLEKTGRFFYDPKKEETHKNLDDKPSNSVLLYKDTNRLSWSENVERPNQQVQLQQAPQETKSNIRHGSCQTDVTTTETKCVQATVTTMDFAMQVCPYDLEQASKDEKRPIMDRLDWNVRESFDYSSKHHRESDDLRWSLGNSQKRSWTRGGSSPSRRSHEEPDYYMEADAPSGLHGSRKVDSPNRSRDRDSYSGQRGSPADRYSRDSYSPVYGRAVEEHDSYHERRSDYSRGESPALVMSDEEIETPEHSFHRRSDWTTRGRSSRGRASSLSRPYSFRGKYSGRPFRGRGSFRGKY